MTGKKIVALVFILSGVAILAAFGVVYFLRGRQPNAGLKIETTPPSLVFVDNQQLGKTPFDKLFRSGDITVKLIPDSASSAIGPYQTQVRLSSQVYTVINRDFGSSESDSAGEVVIPQPQSQGQTSLSVITSSPDSASVSIDDQPQGLTPLLVSPISPGDHKISLSAPGFAPRTVNVQTVSGYKLQISAKLAGPVPISPTPVPSTPAPAAKPQVTILDTPTGFLRVRQGPSTSASESGRIKPGETYPLLKTEGGWFLIQIELPSTSSGWISSEYAQKSQ
ncbi:PEGA domain-containing protein [Candidatus Amesbacteria bacterium]|nr:PEGA domain-containing protein [Candidatus Amesbacteria bacterium]